MKHLSALLVVLLAGCSGIEQLTPNVHRNNLTTPHIEFVGDDISIGLVAYANNPMWKCTDCAQRATSGQLLEALPLAIANKPDLIHILTGSYDVDDPNWLGGACNGDSPDASRRTCANLESMVLALNAARIP